MLFWIAVVAALVVLLFVAFLGLGAVGMRRNVAQAESKAATVTGDQIPALAAECEEVFAREFDISLADADLETVSEALGRFLKVPDIERLKTAFAEDGFYWRFVLTVGAFLGEFVRKHQAAEWVPSELGDQLALQIGEGENTLTIHPFDKVIKQALGGHPEELKAYLEIATGAREVPVPNIS